MTKTGMTIERMAILHLGQAARDYADICAELLELESRPERNPDYADRTALLWDLAMDDMAYLGGILDTLRDAGNQNVQAGVQDDCEREKRKKRQ